MKVLMLLACLVAVVHALSEKPVRPHGININEWNSSPGYNNCTDKARECKACNNDMPKDMLKAIRKARRGNQQLTGGTMTPPPKTCNGTCPTKRLLPLYWYKCGVCEDDFWAYFSPPITRVICVYPGRVCNKVAGCECSQMRQCRPHMLIFHLSCCHCWRPGAKCFKSGWCYRKQYFCYETGCLCLQRITRVTRQFETRPPVTESPAR